ncbi:hypothetical protein [Actinoplanes derwentensis]|uniref:Uncharacterized protein n=1 Tax=Actinoplanes derwentensis TaxID=113562 RepID=A0A1H1W3B4_9ACTN|nr:hypothetical protein [Actinoplanes derwentensis]GID84025.1 hypothetical protein Ade03nite_29490 [Actinoplanes derwentensis]SDS91161.1 hypothetical protein SAMN04489716_1960 [Actinoplanes derwentensis]
MSRLRRALIGAAMLPLAAGTVVAATATPAAAKPNLCTIASKNINWSNMSSWTRCQIGTGYYRVRITCAPSPTSGGTYFYGYWFAPQTQLPSAAQCPSSHGYILGATTELA